MGLLRTTRWLPCALAVALSCAAASKSTLHTPAESPWQHALQARDSLESLPAPDRTRAMYLHAEDACRAVFYASPADQHAPASILALAALLAEQGRAFHDPHASEAAATQYRFLRTQYPESSLLAEALLAEAHIRQDDLNDPAAARTLYLLLLRSHPHATQAALARASLATLSPAKPAGHPARLVPSTANLASDPTATQPPPPALTPTRSTTQTAGRPDTQNRRIALPPMATTAELAPRDTIPVTAQPRTTNLPIAETPLPAIQPAAISPHHHAATLTGIRHWSTPDYTRVALDLGEDVTYEAARVPSPDRLLFDLHGTRLAPELAGKTFNLTDDSSPGSGGFLHRIRAAQATPDTTRVILDVADVTEYSAFLLPNPSRLIIDIHGRPKALAQQASTAPSPAPRVAQTQHPTPSTPVPNTVAAPATPAEVASISQQPGKIEATVRPTTLPIAAIVPVNLGKRPKPETRPESKLSEASAPAKPAAPTAAGETSLIRALGLKINRIVIDAGHGGHDSGTIGVGGIQEKDVVLDVALRLGKLLHTRLGAEIIYTRSDDTFIPLETRTAIANKAQADLFLSIHANSSPDPTARGVETFYLNFTQSADALEVAARENAVSGQSIHQLSDLVKKITLKDKIEESREFAADIEQSLYKGLATGPDSSANEGLKDRGVKKAPFVVLIGANMPSILAEISFVTNDRDADQLRRPDYRQRVAESLFQGVRTYESGLSAPRPTQDRASRD